MRVEQLHWRADGGWTPAHAAAAEEAQLVLLFGGKAALRDKGAVEDLRSYYPRARMIGCSTAGEICGEQVADESLVSTAIHFEHSRVVAEQAPIRDAKDSRATGRELASRLDPTDLAHVFVLSDGLSVNGSELVQGLTESLPESITITGGLSADGDRFQETLVLGDGSAEPGKVAIVGLYGKRLRVGYASLGGWDPFGPERVITRSEGNVLYELDGRSALQLYKKYLGDAAEGLPGTGLLFPLALRPRDGDQPVVRTILAVDEDAHSVTFAGDVPEGWYGRLMRANFDRLVDGAAGAAKNSYQALGGTPPDLAVLISCVGRRMVLKQRVEEELEAVRDIFGPSTVLTGFYSYGEISPFTPNARCQLHNQTMTITAFSEAA